MDYDQLIDAVFGVLGDTFQMESFDDNTMESLRSSLFVTLTKCLEPMITEITNDAKSVVVQPIVKKARRPPTAYNLFTKHYQATHPDTTQLFKDAGADWKSLTPEQRQPFMDRAAAMAEEHGRAKNAQKTKRPPTAYNLFMKQYKVDHPDVENLFVTAAAAWRELDVASKQVWKDNAAALRPKKTAKKGVLNGYNVFLAAKMSTIAQEHPAWDNRQKMKYVASLWNKCTEEDKSVWKTRAAIKNVENAAKETANNTLPVAHTVTPLTTAATTAATTVHLD